MNPIQFFNDIASNPNIADHVKLLPIYLKELDAGTATADAGQRFLEPGLFLTNPLTRSHLVWL